MKKAVSKAKTRRIKLRRAKLRSIQHALSAEARKRGLLTEKQLLRYLRGKT